MKKVMKKFNRALSIMLVAAMVLTMAPQTAMPVLAASDDAVVTTGTDEPAGDGEANVGGTVEAPEIEQNEEIADPSDEGNSNTEGDDISSENPVDEDPVEEEPSEGDVEEPAVEEEEDPTITTNEVVAMEDKPDAPTITLKEGDKSIQSGATVSHAAVITFEIAPVKDDVTYKYTLDDTKPSTENGEEYTQPVDIISDITDEKTVTIQAIAIKAAVGTEGQEGYVPAQESAPATATVTFEAKKKTVKLAADSAVGVTIKAGTTVINTSGMDLDPSNTLKLTVELDETVSKTQEIEKLQYKDADEKITDWTDAEEANGVYTIPKDALVTDILVRATLKKMPELTFALGNNSTYGMFTVNLTVKKGTKVLKNNEALTLTSTDNKVSIPSGTVVTATIKAKTKCTLVEVKLKDETVTLAANKASATVNVSKANALLDGDATITVTASEDYLKTEIVPMAQNQGKATETKAKVWTVEPRFDYIISAKAGGDGKFPISKAEVAGSVSENDVKLTDITGKDSENQDVPTGTYKLEVKEPAAGKNFTVKLYKDADGKEALDTITINVAPAITKVTVAKATGAGKNEISQIIGTTEGYTLTLDTKEKTSTDVLKAEIPTGGDPKAFIDHVEVDGNKTLVIITNLVKIEDDVEAQINIVNESASNKVVKTLTVKPAVLSWDEGNKGGMAPTVKVDNASATDTSLKLNMTVPKGVTEEDVYKGECYYVVKAEPVSKDTTKNDYIEAERYYKATGNSMSQVVPVINAAFGGGRSEKFNVTVKLCQYVDVTEPGGGTTAPKGTLIATSKAAEVKNAATKEPYYADKITLKKTKWASGIYTGQTESVATIDFGKNTTYNRDGDVTAVVEGQTGTDADNIIKAEIDKSTVKLTVGKNVNPGKYNICVTQTVQGETDVEAGCGIPEGAKPTSATLQVTVVRGIKDITLTAQPEIYVSAKGGTAKIAVTYNDGTNATKPKTAKVTYELAAVDENDAVVTDKDAVKKVTDWVTVNNNNGTVTVKKNYKGEIESGKFAVRAKAADFTDNSATSDYTTFTIRDTERTLGDIVIVTKDSDKYKPVADKDAKGTFVIKADQLANTYVRVLKAPVDGEQPKTEYVENDFEEKAYYDLTLSNKKDVSVKDDFTLSASKVVSNVTVNAVANDGGKKKSPNSGKVKFSITYADVTNAKLQIKVGTTAGGNFEDFTADDKKFTANGKSAKQVYTVKAMEGTNELGDKLVDYKITAGKGAKIVKAGFPEAQVMMTADVAELNLVGPKDSKGKPQTTTYKIENNVLVKTNTTTAPKITLAKGEKIYTGFEGPQWVEFTIAKGLVPDAAKIVISAEQDGASQALLETLATNDIELGEDGDIQLSDKEAVSVTLEFTADVPATKKAILYFDFVKDDGTALTKAPASVTLKTEVLKKSYKLNTKYTMSAKDLAKVQLTNSGKMEGVEEVTFTELLNANIGGKINDFTGTGNAFALNDEKTHLVLANPAKAYSDKKSKVNNLTGFVVYTVTYKDGKSDTFTTQITVTMKDSKPVRTLKADKVSVIAVKDQTTTLTVKAGKDGVTLLDAVYENDNKDGDNKAAKEYFKMVELTNAMKTAGTVELKLTELPTKMGVQKGKLTVLIGDSFAADQWSTANETTKAELLEKYGITINTQVDVKATSTKNMVKIDSKDPGLNFAKAEESNGKYSQTIAYTPVVSATITGIAADDTLDKNKVPATPTWITMQSADDNQVEIIIDQAGYVTYVKDGAKTVKGKVSYPRNGAAVNAAVKFTYADGAAVDSIKIKITPPKLDESIFEAESEDTIDVTVSPATTSVKKGETQAFTAVVKINNEEKAEESEKVAWSVTGASDNKTKFEGSTLTVGSDETVESLTVTATYTKDGKDYKGTATVTVTN